MSILINIVRIVGIILILFGLSGIYYSYEVQRKIWEYPLKFFTYISNIGAILTVLTLFFAIFYNKNYKGLYYNILPPVYSIELAITIMYWTVYLYDKKLIVSKYILDDKLQLPIIYDLLYHGFPLLFLIHEFTIYKFENTKSHYLNLIFFGTFYYLILILTYYKFNNYPYNFLNRFNYFTLILFIASLTLIFIFLMRLTVKIFKKYKK